jgi:hypothetical protein
VHNTAGKAGFGGYWRAGFQEANDSYLGRNNSIRRFLQIFVEFKKANSRQGAKTFPRSLSGVGQGAQLQGK